MTFQQWYLGQYGLAPSDRAKQRLRMRRSCLRFTMASICASLNAERSIDVDFLDSSRHIAVMRLQMAE